MKSNYSFAALPIELQGYILSFLPNPRTLVNKKLLKFQTDRIFQEETEKSRKWQAKFLKKLMEGPVFYSPFDQKSTKQLQAYLTGQYIQAEYRLDLMGYFLMKDKGFTLSRKDWAFLEVCLNVRGLKLSVIPCFLHSLKPYALPKKLLLDHLYSYYSDNYSMHLMNQSLQFAIGGLALKEINSILRWKLDNKHSVKAIVEGLHIALSRIEHSRLIHHIDELKSLSKHENFMVRLEVALFLVRDLRDTTSHPLPEIFEILKPLSNDKDWGVRHIVARSYCYAVACLGMPACLEYFEQLNKLIGDQSAYIIRKSVAKRLGCVAKDLEPLAAQKAIEILMTLSNDSIEEVRGGAIQGLIKTLESKALSDQSQRLDYLTTLSTNKNITIRKIVAEELSQVIGALDLSHQALVLKIVDSLSQDNFPYCRKVVAKGLTKSLGLLYASNQEKAFKILGTLSKDKNFLIREEVAKGLFQILVDLDSLTRLRGLEILKFLSEDMDASNRKSVVNGLRDCFERLSAAEQLKVFDIMKALFTDPDVLVRSAAIGGVYTQISQLDSSVQLKAINGLKRTLKSEECDIYFKIHLAESLSEQRRYLDACVHNEVRDVLEILSKDPHIMVKKALAKGLCTAIEDLSSFLDFQGFTLVQTLSRDNSDKVKKKIVKVLCGAIKHPQSSARQTGFKFLTRISKDNNELVRRVLIKEVSAALQYLDPSSQENALELIIRTSNADIPFCIECLSESIRGVGEPMQWKVLKILENMSDYGNSQEKKAVAKSLRHVFTHMYLATRLKSIEIVMILLNDSYQEVNIEAVKSLGQGLKYLNSSKQIEILELFQSVSTSRQLKIKMSLLTAVCQAITDIDSSLYSTVLSILTTLAQDPTVNFRRKVAENLSKCIDLFRSSQCDQGLQLLWTLFNDESTEVKRATVKGLIHRLDDLNPWQVCKVMQEVARLDFYDKKLMYNEISYMWPNQTFREKLTQNFIKPLVFQCQKVESAKQEVPIESKDIKVLVRSLRQ